MIRQNPRTGRWEVRAYDPATKTTTYVKASDFGKEPPRNERQARDLERTAILHYKQGGGEKPEPLIREYAEQWLDVHHGKGTRRPAPSTYSQNFYNLNPFLERFGACLLDGGISRGEALRWATTNPTSAKTASAMLNDALDEELARVNPLANRRQPTAPGRKHIEPLTEAEVDRMGELALTVHEGYGVVCRAWILFAAWVGARPAEYFALTWDSLDFEQGLVRVKRCKPPYRVEEVIFPRRAQEAVLAMPHRTGLLFPTVQGKQQGKDRGGYYFRPVRKALAAWLAEHDPERLARLRAVRGSMDLYACRHACASWIVANGGDEFDVSRQLGNTPQVARETYIHRTDADPRLTRVRGLLDVPAPVSLQEAREKRGA